MLPGFWYRALPGDAVFRERLERATLLESPMVIGRRCAEPSLRAARRVSASRHPSVLRKIRRHSNWQWGGGGGAFDYSSSCSFCARRSRAFACRGAAFRCRRRKPHKPRGLDGIPAPSNIRGRCAVSIHARTLRAERKTALRSLLPAPAAEVSTVRTLCQAAAVYPTAFFGSPGTRVLGLEHGNRYSSSEVKVHTLVLGVRWLQPFPHGVASCWHRQ